MDGIIAAGDHQTRSKFKVLCRVKAHRPRFIFHVVPVYLSHVPFAAGDEGKKWNVHRQVPQKTFPHHLLFIDFVRKGFLYEINFVGIPKIFSRRIHNRLAAIET